MNGVARLGLWSLLGTFATATGQVGGVLVFTWDEAGSMLLLALHFRGRRE